MASVSAVDLNAKELWSPLAEFERVAFFGQMASGKTYLAKHLEVTYGYRRVAFADKLKAIAYDLFHVQGKNGRDRIILQQIGDSMCAIDQDVWINYVFSTLKNRVESGFTNKHSPIVIDDLRLINEAEALRANGFKLIRVDVEENQRLARVSTLYPKTATEAVLHASEQEYKAITPDYTILNNNGVDSLLDLERLVEPKIE